MPLTSEQRERLEQAKQFFNTHGFLDGDSLVSIVLRDLLAMVEELDKEPVAVNGCCPTCGQELILQSHVGGNEWPRTDKSADEPLRPGEYLINCVGCGMTGTMYSASPPPAEYRCMFCRLKIIADSDTNSEATIKCRMCGSVEPHQHFIDHKGNVVVPLESADMRVSSLWPYCPWCGTALEKFAKTAGSCPGCGALTFPESAAPLTDTERHELSLLCEGGDQLLTQREKFLLGVIDKLSAAPGLTEEEQKRVDKLDATGYDKWDGGDMGFMMSLVKRLAAQPEEQDMKEKPTICEWCAEKIPLEWSYHSNTYIHRRDTLDRECMEPPQRREWFVKGLYEGVRQTKQEQQSLIRSTMMECAGMVCPSCRIQGHPYIRKIDGAWVHGENHDGTVYCMARSIHAAFAKLAAAAPSKVIGDNDPNPSPTSNQVQAGKMVDGLNRLLHPDLRTPIGEAASEAKREGEVLIDGKTWEGKWQQPQPPQRIAGWYPCRSANTLTWIPDYFRSEAELKEREAQGYQIGERPAKKLSRQRRWQLRQVAAGRCQNCGRKRKHHAQRCDKCRVAQSAINRKNLSLRVK